MIGTKPAADKSVGLHGWSQRSSNLISVIAVACMLTGAMVIVTDVLLRWLFGAPIIALNEIMSQVFAVAVAATLPVGVARRINLRVDLFAAQTGSRLTAWLTAFGSLLLLVFFLILAWRVFGIAVKFHQQARYTSILAWPLAPTYFAVFVALAATVLVQAGIVIFDLLAAIRTRGADGSTLVVKTMVGVLALTLLGFGLWAAFDFKGASQAMMAEPGLFVMVAFGLLWLGVFAQLPLAAVSGLIGVFGTAFFLGNKAAGNVFATDAMTFLTNSQVATLPLFLMMGSFAATAGISTDIYRLANAILGRVRGGLAYASVAGCAGFGAVCGSSVATAATFGRIALPEMKNRGYDARLSSGVIAAGGTLGALVPPSGAIILFALLTEQSIGTLFIAAMIPAALALFLYFITIRVVIWLRPGAVPATEPDAGDDLGGAIIGALPVMVLFGIVVGGLYGGVFTATESAAVGAVGAFVLAAARGKINRQTALSVMSETTLTTALIYGLIFGALIFSFFVNLGQAPDMVVAWIGTLDARPVVILMVLLFLYLLLGSVMDSFAVMVITVPIVTPLILNLGYDITFWGVLMLVIVETGMITPPFGLNLFVLKSIQPEVKIGRVMLGVIPFIIADVVKIVLLVAFPALALWLPSTMN
ncbi:MAG: TRAP transporter large permease subunit [Rhodobacteraceae bacterium]|nr:TRAP transporter large permease subunit [Paracoccaceae bacterium]